MTDGPDYNSGARNAVDALLTHWQALLGEALQSNEQPPGRFWQRFDEDMEIARTLVAVM